MVRAIEISRHCCPHCWQIRVHPASTPQPDDNGRIASSYIAGALTQGTSRKVPSARFREGRGGEFAAFPLARSWLALGERRPQHFLWLGAGSGGFRPQPNTVKDGGGVGGGPSEQLHSEAMPNNYNGRGAVGWAAGQV